MTRASLILVCLLPVFALPVFTSGNAWATDSATAEVLFKEAKALSTKGDFFGACPKFEESQRLDPGMGTLYNLADCYEHTGKYATAWAKFLEVADAAKQAARTEREEDARSRAKAIESRVSHMTLKVDSPADGLVVTRDGNEVGKAQWGLRLPVDGGTHALKAIAPGKKPWEQQVVIQDELTVSVPALEDLPVTVVPDQNLVTKGPTTIVVNDGGAAQRTLGWVAIGLGGVGVGLGAVFGILSMSEKSKANGVGGCDTSTNICTTPEGPGYRDTARTDGTISTIGFIGGAVFLGGGIALLLTAPKKQESVLKAGISGAPVIGQNTLGLSMKGVW